MSSRREQARAVFLSLLMVLSVFGATIAFSGTAAAAVDSVAVTNEPLVSGSHSQQLGELNITVSGTSSGTANVSLPGDASYNQSNSDLAFVEVKSSSTNAQISNIRFENGHLKFDYSGLGGAKTSFVFGQLSVDVPKTEGSSFDIRARVGASVMTKTVSLEEATASGGGGSVGAGNSGQALNNITIDTPNASGIIGAGTEIVITAPTSSGISFDTSASVGAAGANASKVDAANATITSSEIRIPVDSTFDADDTVKVTGLKVNVTGDASQAKLTVTTEPVDSLGTFSVETANVNVTRPTLDHAQTTLAVGLKDQTLAGNGNVTINSTDDGQITDGTNVTLKLNGNAATFNTSANVQAYVNGSAADLPEVVTETMITFEVNQTLAAGEKVNFTNISFDVPASATDGANVTITGETGEGGEVIIEETDGDAVEVQAPELTLSESTVLVDNDGETGVSVNPVRVRVQANGSVAAGTNITVRPAGDTGVTFDSSKSVSLELVNSSADKAEITPDNDTQSQNTNHTLQIRVEGDVVGSSLAEVQVDYSGTSVDDVSNVGQGDIQQAFLDKNNNGVFDSGTDVSVRGDLSSVSHSSGILSIEFGGNYDLVEDDVIVIKYGSGTSNDVSNPTASGDYSIPITINPDSGNVTRTANLDIDAANSATDETVNALGGTVATPGVVVNNTFITFELTNGLSAGDNLTIRGIQVNVTAGASNTTLEADTNTSENVITITSNNQIVVSDASPSSIKADAEYAGTFASDTSGVGPQIGDTQQGAVRVNDSNANPFGGASVTLTITDTPNGSSGASVESPVTTNSNGIATFNFTAGDKVGTYNVTAETASGANVTISYNVNAGPAAQVNVTPVKDGLVGGDGTKDRQRSVLRVRIEDSGGNVNDTASLDVQTVLTGDANVYGGFNRYNMSTGALMGEFNDTDADDRLNYNVSNDTADNGTFYVVITDTVAEDVTTSVDPEGSVSEDSATTSFFSIDNVAVSFNDSEVTAGETVAVTAIPKDGDVTVTVPRVSVSLDSTNTTVANIVTSTTVSTNSSGITTATVSTSTAGTSNITATARNKQGRSTLSVLSQSEGASDVSLTADPAASNDSSTHTVMATIGETSEGNALSQVEVDYSAANNTDVSNVTMSDVSTAGVDTDGDGTVDTSANVTGVSVSGQNVTVSFNGSITLAMGDTVMLTYDNLTNPEPGTYDVTVTVNDPTATPVDQATASLTTQAEPDLTISDVGAPQNVTQGDSVTVDVVVANDGGAEGTGTVNLTVGGITRSTQVTVSAGGVQTVTFTYDSGSLTPGTYTQTATVGDSSGSQDIVVEQGAFVTFENQTVENPAVTDQQTVTVRSVTLPEGGFVVIHTVPVVPEGGSAADSVIGNSMYLSNGTHENVTVTLDEPISENQTLVAMAHRDTDGDQTYDFPEADGPYVTASGGPVIDSASVSVEPVTLDDVRNATEAYQNFSNAKADGYHLEPAFINSTEGAMGFHAVNPSLMEDGEVNPLQPEVLTYTVNESTGELELLGVEYFVNASRVDERPTLFGQNFSGPMPGHSPGQPEHYELHAWAFSDNPAGTFATWNPAVERPDLVTFDAQTSSSGEQVTVQKIIVPDGGFVVVHNASGAVLGHSEYLTPGMHMDVNVTLDQPISQNQTLIAMAHTDDGDQTYEFPDSDGPYVWTSGEPGSLSVTPFVDAGAVTVPEQGPPAISDDLEPPTNLDDDNKFEDTNGNGRFDIGDVQALFANRNSDAVRNNVDAFDFNNNDQIDIGDIQALFVEYQAST